jgi:hypothetical protein
VYTLLIALIGGFVAWIGTYHTWTDAEIDQYERRWPLGTRERLAFALLLKMMRSDIVGDRIRVAQDKARKGTTNELMIRIHPALARALSAGPVVGMQHLITDARGKPLRNLTDLIERAVKLAGLPPRCVAHGLRKAALRGLAEHGSTTKEIAAVSGHRSLSEIERYTAKADQAGLADSAIGKLPDAEAANGFWKRPYLLTSAQVSNFATSKLLTVFGFIQPAT